MSYHDIYEIEKPTTQPYTPGLQPPPGGFPTGSPYEDLFKLPTVSPYESSEYEGITTDLNWDELTSEDYARIQQDPRLQMEYVLEMLSGGAGPGYFGGKGIDIDVSAADFVAESAPFAEQVGLVEGDYSEYTDIVRPKFIDMAEDKLKERLGRTDEFGFSIEEFMQFDENRIRELVNKIGWVDRGDVPQETIDQMVSYYQEVQEGMRKLQGGDIGIDALQTELGGLKKNIFGQGGLMQKKSSLADMLIKSASSKRGTYAEKEKAHRYLGGADPTKAYVQGRELDFLQYGADISGIDKSISDILTGTDAGSIHDVYGKYGNLVSGSLTPGGQMWWA